MEENFKFEIINPDEIIFSDAVKMVKIPSYEGDMSLLKNHISIITFLRPGLVRVEKKDGNFEEFFVQDGILEFFDNILILLSSSVINVKNLSNDLLNSLTKEAEDQLTKKNITDQDRYILNHKLDTIKEIRV